VIRSKTALRALAVTSLAILAATSGSEPDAAQVVGALASEATPDDALPAAVAGGLHEHRLSPDSVRLLRRQGEVRHYVATNAGDELCLIAVRAAMDSADVAAASCARPSDVRDHGLPLRLRAGEQVTLAVLVPDGYESASRGDGRGQIKVTDNIVSIDSATRSSMPDDLVLQPQWLGDHAIQVPIRPQDFRGG